MQFWRPVLKQHLLLVAIAPVAIALIAGGVLERDLLALLRLKAHHAVIHAPALAQCQLEAITLLAALLLTFACLALALGLERVEARRSSEKMEALEQFKQRITTRMSHELRTPLTAIKGAAWLLEIDSTGERQPQFVRMIRRNSDRLAEQIQLILELAALEDGVGHDGQVPARLP